MASVGLPRPLRRLPKFRGESAIAAALSLTAVGVGPGACEQERVRGDVQRVVDRHGRAHHAEVMRRVWSIGVLILACGGTGACGGGASDCAAMRLPGNPADLMATPRADEDVEVLALSVDPSLVVAPQVRYEVVHADLEAIRAIEPALAGVHVDPLYPGLAFWFSNAEANFPEVGDSDRWRCANELYHAGELDLIDTAGSDMPLDGIYGDVVVDVYADMPEFEDATVERCCERSWCFQVACEDPPGSIVLEATIDPDGGLVVRDYRFESPEVGVRVYRMEPGQAPVLLA